MLTNYYELLVSLLRQETSQGPQKDILGARRVEFVCGFQLHVRHLWNHTEPLRWSKLTSPTGLNSRTASASVSAKMKQNYKKANQFLSKFYQKVVWTPLLYRFQQNSRYRQKWGSVRGQKINLFKWLQFLT